MQRDSVSTQECDSTVNQYGTMGVARQEVRLGETDQKCKCVLLHNYVHAHSQPTPFPCPLLPENMFFPQEFL